MSVNQSFLNLAPPLNGDDDDDNTQSNEVSFVTIVLAIVIAWTLVALWTRVIENLSFNALGLNGNSFYHALIIAILFTVIFIAFVWVIDQYNLVPGTLTAEVEGEGGLQTTRGQSNVAQLPPPSSNNRNGQFIPPSVN